MKYTVFPVHKSTLSGQALADRVLSKYTLPVPISCKFLRQGVNDTYVVAAGSSTYYLRVYRYGWRTKAEIEAELDMLTYLQRRHLPVSSPIKRKDGSVLTRIEAPEGVRYAVLFTNAPGRQMDMDNKQSGAYGELAGKIHLSLDKTPEDARRFHLDLSHLVDEPLAKIAPFLKHRSGDLDYLRKAGGELKAAIAELLPKAKPEYGYCHGDHHGWNVNIDKDGALSLYDFDCSGYGWRAYDLAVFLWNRTFDWSAKGKSKRTRRWNAFLSGYAKVRTLSPQELRATEIFVPIRHLWLVGFHAQDAETGPRGWLDDGFFDREIGFIKRCIEALQDLVRVSRVG